MKVLLLLLPIPKPKRKLQSINMALIFPDLSLYIRNDLHNICKVTMQHKGNQYQKMTSNMSPFMEQEPADGETDHWQWRFELG